MSLTRIFADSGRSAERPRSGRRPRTGRRLRRRLICEALESRRLLVAEGAIFSLNANADAAGLLGNLSADIRWGDGTQSSGTVTGGNTTGNLRIRFDYTFDTGGFFAGANASRRALLQSAADALVKRFNDNLSAITPAGQDTWTVSIFHPSSGAANQLSGTITPLPPNPVVAANEIVVYAGARDLPGSTRGVGGFAAQTSVSFINQSFADAVRGRGQPGALATPQRDVAPHIGSVSFDTKNSDGTPTNWYFDQAGGIQPGQIDFLSVATHELAHVLGFGTSNSWDRLVSGGTFTGANARAAYVGSGNVPTAPTHWAQSVIDGQPSIMGAVIETGVRQLFSPLDFAAMKDIGWEVLSTSVQVTGQHRYADDGNYPIEVLLRGANNLTSTHSAGSAAVTNVAPTLTVVAAQTAKVGQSLDITDLGVITDPGFANVQANPPTAETFDYTINWGDGSPLDAGTATIDVQGNANGTLTRASFNGSHTYATEGNKTVTVRVVDDNGGVAQQTFSVTVNPVPALTLELSQPAIDENAGLAAAVLTVRRSGQPTGSPQTINLSSSDSSEATVPATVVIPADATFATVNVNAIDDALLDGDQTISLMATAPGLQPDDIELLVRDHESLTAFFTQMAIRENEPNSVSLLVRRSNTDTGEVLAVSISGGNAAQLALPTSVNIPSGSQQVMLPISAVDDNDPERTLPLTYTFTAAGYQSASAKIDLLDDEPPLFQNISDRFDVNNMDGVSSLDALRIINQLTIRGGAADLDPDQEQPNGVFFDVNGDYRISALDALQIINELARRQNVNQTSELAEPFAAIQTLDDDWRKQRARSSFA